MTTKIDKDTWIDAMNGKGNNPVAEDDIRRRTEKGEVTVVDPDGNEFTPVKGDDDKWKLEPKTTS